MGKVRVSMMIRSLLVLSFVVLITGCGGGGGGSAAGEGDTTPDAGSLVTFTYTLASGQINSLPADADHVKVVLDGKESTVVVSALIMGAPASVIAASAATGTLAFSVKPGEHAYTVQALKGAAVLATIGPITFTKVADIPATIPLAFAFNSFTTSKTEVITDATVPYFGTADPDRCVQYSGAANDLLSVDMGADDDWTEQYGGDGDDTMVADMGTGNDYAYQDGGAGNNVMTATAGQGDDWAFQRGSSGKDNLDLHGGDGNDCLYQEGGDEIDTIRVNGGLGNDTATIYAGTGNDIITYDVSEDTDTALIDGGDGTDTLTVNTKNLPVKIKDSAGNTMYSNGSDTTITVMNVETITVLDKDGNQLWPVP